MWRRTRHTGAKPPGGSSCRVFEATHPNFQALGMNIVGKGLHAVRELLRVWLQVTRGIALRVGPAVVHVQVLVPKLVQPLLNDGVSNGPDLGIRALKPGQVPCTHWGQWADSPRQTTRVG